MNVSASDSHTLPVGKYILFPDTILKYPCEMCGKCCNSFWAVQLEQVEFFRYRRILEESHIHHEYRSCLQEIKKDNRITYQLLPHKDRCIYLQDDNKCYIHLKEGPDAKSRTCKFFPLSASAFSPRGMHLKISFNCVASLKSLLHEDSAQISSNIWDNNLTCNAVLRFAGDCCISWQDAFRVTDALSSFFNQSDLTVENKLLTASRWVSALNTVLNGDRLDEFRAYAETEYLFGNTEELLEQAERFEPEPLEQVKLLNHIAEVLLEGNSELVRESSVCNFIKLLNPDSPACIDTMRMGYRTQYVSDLHAFTAILERYCTHKIVSYELFIKQGILFGMNKLALCYGLMRVYLLAKIIYEKKMPEDDDILETISFVEMILFHNQSATYLDTSHIVKILSNPHLSLLLLRI